LDYVFDPNQFSALCLYPYSKHKHQYGSSKKPPLVQAPKEAIERKPTLVQGNCQQKTTDYQPDYSFIVQEYGSGNKTHFLMGLFCWHQK
jgi:hypothetical protein